MRNEAFEEAVTRVLKTDARFPREAYRLISVALEHAVRALHADRRDGTASDETDASGRQHVTADLSRWWSSTRLLCLAAGEILSLGRLGA